MWLKKQFKSTTFSVCAYYAITSIGKTLRYSLGSIQNDHTGTTHRPLTLDQSVAYITGAFSDYKCHSGVEQFYGRVAEVGPGDNCGVALLFLADGCERVDLFDRFYAVRDTSQQARIYQRLVELYPALRQRCRVYPPIDEFSFEGLYPHYGESGTAERAFSANHGYDFIVSRSALQTLTDPVTALRGMVRALNDGGMLLHEIDLRDYTGMFSNGFYELKFLEIPEWIYKHMAYGYGRPNRIRVDRYRDILQDEGLSVSVLVTHLAQVGEVSPHVSYGQIDKKVRDEALLYIRALRDRFARDFDAVSDEDLSVCGFFLIAAKPKDTIIGLQNGEHASGSPMGQLA